jgi:hypothetical protein
MLKKPLTGNGPIIITGTAGTGTRVFCDLLEKAGVFMGSRKNAEKDNLDFIELIKKGIPLSTPGCLNNENYLSIIKSPDFSPEILDNNYRDRIRKLIHQFKKRMLKDLKGNGDTRWGWKESQSMFVLPFLFEVFPDLTLVHIIRDGRDIAFSQQQKKLYQASYIRLLNHEYRINIEDKDYPLWVAKTWEIVNLGLNCWAKKNLKESKYYLIKLENLEYKNTETIFHLYEFLKINFVQDYKRILEKTDFDQKKLSVTGHL